MWRVCCVGGFVVLCFAFFCVFCILLAFVFCVFFLCDVLGCFVVVGSCVIDIVSLIFAVVFLLHYVRSFRFAVRAFSVFLL